MPSDRQEQLVQLLTANQTRLYGFILTLLPNREQARDVLQETNLVIWRKASEFEPGTNFWAWACKIARFRVLAYYRDSDRDMHVFDESVLNRVATAAEDYSADDDRRAALLGCLKKLTPPQLTLIQQRYGQETPLQAIAAEQRSTVGAIKMALLRVRRALLECVESSLETPPKP